MNPSRAISKRLRYEILRRDNHACRYCGRTAPDVKLHIDHVVPVILGGTDDPSNLVTACSDCNGGKTSSAPDQAVVADVDDRAVRWAAAMTQAAEEMRRVIDERADIYATVIDAFHSFYQRYVPDDYAATIDRFIDAGLPIEVMIEMARIASSKRGVDQRWNYFCGCCWTRIRQMQDRAKEIVGGDESPAGRADLTSREYLWVLIHGRIQDVWSLWDEVGRIPLDQFFCRHGIEWTYRCFVRGDSWISEEPCVEHRCLTAYASFWECEVQRIANESVRQLQVMDAADELELVH